MPNYVFITFTVLGTKNCLNQFVQQARGTCKITEDLSDRIRYFVNHEESSFDFNCLVPLPEEYSKVPYSPNWQDPQSPNGYDMELQTWGVKWGAFDVEGPIITYSSETYSSATYTFICAFSAPRVFCEKLSRKWADLFFIVSYGGEGPTLGCFTLYNGKYINSIDRALNESPRYPEGDNISEDAEEKWSESYTAWEQQYRQAHEIYVTTIKTYLID